MLEEGPCIGRRNLRQGGGNGTLQRVTRARGRATQIRFDLSECQLDRRIIGRIRRQIHQRTATPRNNCLRPFAFVGAEVVRQHDLTFGDTNRGGVRVDFREPVSQMGVRIPALYLTVEDIGGFAAALAERGLPGTDTRRPARLAMPDAGQDDALAHAADRDPLASLGRTSAVRTSHSQRRSDPRMHIGVVAGGVRMSVSW